MPSLTNSYNATADMTPAEELAVAVKANDAQQVAGVLERRPTLRSTLNDPMPGGDFGATPLLAAVARSNVEMIDVLLRAGADINQKSHWWAGPFGVLDTAARPDKDSGLAEWLIERGAFVDVHAASRLGRLDRLAELVAADPGLVHARGADGRRRCTSLPPSRSRSSCWTMARISRRATSITNPRLRST